jgi:hypothetical protein
VIPEGQIIFHNEDQGQPVTGLTIPRRPHNKNVVGKDNPLRRSLPLKPKSAIDHINQTRSRQNLPLTMQELDSPAEANDSSGSLCRISDDAEHQDYQGASSSIGQMPFSLFNKKKHVPSDSNVLSTKRQKYSVEPTESPNKPDSS